MFQYRKVLEMRSDGFSLRSIRTATGHSRQKITHSICVVRDDEHSDFKVLSPCGVCQERLRYWGPEVKVGVTAFEKELKFVTLDTLQPYHWTNAYPEEVEYYKND